MFKLCVVYLVESSLLGSAWLTGYLCLLRPDLRPGSTRQWVSCVVLSRHFGPSSRILAGPVSGEIDLSFCDLSYSIYHFQSYAVYHFLSILFLLFLSSVCSVVLCAVSGPWRSSGTVVSSCKSSTLGAGPSSSELLEVSYSSPHTGATKSSTSEAFQHSSLPKSSALEAFTQVLTTGASYSSPHHWGGQVLTTEAISTNPLLLRNFSTIIQTSSSEVVTSRRRPPTDLAAVNHYQASCLGATNQALDQLKALPATIPEEVDFVSSEDLDRTHYSTIYFENTVTATSLTNVIPATRDLGEQLLYLKAGQPGLAFFIYDLELVQGTFSTNLDLKQVSKLQNLLYSLIPLRIQWQTANHPSEHLSYPEMNSHHRGTNNLTAEISTTRDCAGIHSTASFAYSSSPPSICHTKGKNSIITIAMPKVTGNILGWNTLWTSSTFNIKDRKELNATQGLHSLRDSISTSDCQLLLNLPADTSNFIKHPHSDSFLSSLVCPILQSNLQELWAQLLFNFNSFFIFNQPFFPIFNQPFFRSPINLSSDIQSQLLLFLRQLAETLPASGAPLPTTSFYPTPRKNSTKKTDKRQQTRPKQRSNVYSTAATPPATTYQWKLVIYQLEKHLLHICPKWQNSTANQGMSLVSSSNIFIKIPSIHQGATSTVYASSNLSQPQQLPEALLMAAQTILKTSAGQLIKARASIRLDAGLSIILLPTLQALKLPLEFNITILSSVQGTQCKGSQQSTFTNISLLPSNLDIQYRTADVHTVTGILFNVSGRLEIFLRAEWPQLQGESTSISAPASEPGANYVILWWSHHWLYQGTRISSSENPACHLLSTSSTQHSNNSPSNFSLADLAVKLTFSLPPADTPVKQQHVSHYTKSNHVSFLPTNCRQQTTLSEKSNCQPPGKNSRQAVSPKLALSQQPWENSHQPSFWRDEVICLFPIQLFYSLTLTGSDSIIPELHEFSDSLLQNCGALVCKRTNSKEHHSSTFLATSKPSSRTVPNAEHSTICATTDIIPEVLLPLPFWRRQSPLLSEHPGPTLQQLPQKELLQPFHSPTLQQPPQKELLEQSPPVKFSTAISTMAVDLGNSTLTYSHFPSHTDWCWEFCSTFSYDGVLLSAATNCVHPTNCVLRVTKLQTPAASPVSTLTDAERKTAELWLLKQAKLHFSKSSRLQPWHHLQNHQTITADRLPANYCTCKWCSPFYLTLCLCGSILSCTTGFNILLLSARRLSRLASSNSYWRKHSHPQQLQPAECPATLCHPLACASYHSSDPMVHHQFIQCPSTGLSPQLCYSWTDSSLPLPCPDSKPKTSSTSWADKFNSNTEETSPASWRFVSTEDPPAYCSSRSKLLLHLSLLLLHLLLCPLTLQPSMTATLTLQPSMTATLTLQPSMTATLNFAAIKECHSQLDLYKVPLFDYHSHLAVKPLQCQLGSLHSFTTSGTLLRQLCHSHLQIRTPDSCHCGSQLPFYQQLLPLPSKRLCRPIKKTRLSSSSFKERSCIKRLFTLFPREYVQAGSTFSGQSSSSSFSPASLT